MNVLFSKPIFLIQDACCKFWVNTKRTDNKVLYYEQADGDFLKRHYDPPKNRQDKRMRVNGREISV